MAVTIRTVVVLAGAALLLGNMAARAEDSQGWIPLFDGKTLKGWKVSENPSTFAVKDGAIVASGKRAHLYYIGPVEKADFKDFELKVDVMTEPNSNGGIFFHTEFQDKGWPAKGHEAQVNNTFRRDPRKTGSLYGIKDVMKTKAKDNEWFTEHIIVRDKRVIIKVNDETIVDYTETGEPPKERPERRLSSGTIALQGHDPASTVHYKNIFIRPLPNE